jgi:hypothetical protein
MKTGDVFDPVDVARRLKVYPVDIVDAMTDVSDGPKRLYSKLFQLAVTPDRRKYPWNGYVYTSEQYLSKLLGKSVSGVRRDLTVIRDRRLIAVERPNRHESSHYIFLWHETFDSANVGCQDAPTAQPDSANVSALDRPHVGALYKEEPLVEPLTEEQREKVPLSGFSEFQSGYPKPKQKIKIDSACRAYVSVIDGKPGEHERLMDGLARYKASADWQRSLSQDGGRYIPMMEKFIFERRYLDHPPAADEPHDEPPAPEYDPRAADEVIPPNVRMPDWGMGAND